LLPPTVPEVRRLRLIALLTDAAERAFRLGWSDWRRRYQARARRSHYRRRLMRHPARAPPGNSTV